VKVISGLCGAGRGLPGGLTCHLSEKPRKKIKKMDPKEFEIILENFGQPILRRERLR
jgi:hypothetical protein